MTMKLSQPFVRLPYRFDVERLQHELSQFNQTAWMEHPNRLNGNSAIPLISLNGGDNDEFSGHMQVTPHLQRCDYVQQVMAGFGEVLARSRFMRLSPGSEVSEHVDFNYHWYNHVRIHIPITTTPDVTFFCGPDQVHMQAGECWIFDSWKRHKVVNPSNQERIHLVIDTAGSSRFWKIVRQMEQFGSARPNPDINSKISLLAFDPKSSATFKTERFNVAPVMSPGELEAIANELIGLFSDFEQNDPEIVREYVQLLEGLSKDWRECWHLYGYSEEGLPHYKSLLNNTFKQLRPNPRAIITKTNQIGINPIIVQRIIRAALNTDQLDRFKH
ncbi:MAG: hypothetical protein ACI9FR_001748 [Cryomorphaceae bacterium]|jgi:hypothetical protein